MKSILITFTMMKLNDYIKYSRKKNKLTLMNLSQKANISYGMLYRLEDESIKKPKPELLKKVAIALELDYKNLLSRAGYLEGVNYVEENIEKKEYSILDFESFTKNKKNEISRISFIQSENIDYYVKSNTNNFFPYFKEESILGLKKVSTLDGIGKYVFLNKEKANLIFTKKYEDNALLAFLNPDFYIPVDINKLDGEFFKILVIYN